MQQHLALLATEVFGNPHSSNPTSQHSTLMAEPARTAVLRFFNADPGDYVVVFTANASAALRLVGEAYPFDANSTYLLTYDNHNSVNGIREFAVARGAKVVYCPVVGDPRPSARLGRAARCRRLRPGESVECRVGATGLRRGVLL